MAFAGRWQVETQEGYDEFCKLMGVPDNIIDKSRDYRAITEITQDGDDFSWSRIYPNGASITNKFTIGKECDMQTFGEKKLKCTVNMEGDKLCTKLPNCMYVTEISGDKLIETSSCGSVVLRRTSKKI